MLLNCARPEPSDIIIAMKPLNASVIAQNFVVNSLIAYRDLIKSS